MGVPQSNDRNATHGRSIEVFVSYERKACIAVAACNNRGSHLSNHWAVIVTNFAVYEWDWYGLIHACNAKSLF